MKAIACREFIAVALVVFSCSAAVGDWSRYKGEYYSDVRAGAMGFWDSPCRSGLMPLNGRLILDGSDGIHGCELYALDSLNSPPVLLADVTPGAGNSDIEGWSLCGDTLYFVEYIGETKTRELWRTDGTPSGTYRLSVINPVHPDLAPLYTELDCIDGFLYFAGEDADHGFEPWVSDGTGGGTHILTDINPYGDSNPLWFVGFSESIVFLATDSISGAEMHAYDRASNTSRLIADIIPGSDSGSPHFFTPFKNGLLFSAQMAPYKQELYFSDGTAGGTGIIKILNDVRQSPYIKGSDPSDFTVLGDVCIFSGSTNVYGTEPWRTDGTAAGTYLLKDIDPRPYNLIEGGSNPQHFYRFGNHVFFLARNEFGKTQVWYTDGTADGTSLYPGPDGPIETYDTFKEVHGFLYVEAASLWRFDANGGIELVAPTSTWDFSTYYAGLLLGTAPIPGAGYELVAKNANPWVESLSPEVTGPTDAQAVSFLVTFSEPVAGVDPTDFVAFGNGLTGPSPTSVEQVGDGTVWRVTVDTGMGDGTVFLRLLDDDSIVDTWALRWAGDVNPPPLAHLDGYGILDGSMTSASGVLLDKPAPTVLLSTTAPEPTVAGPIVVTATFERPVNGFDEGDIHVVNATLSGFTGSGDSYVFALAPAAQGAVSASIGFDAAQDGGGLGNAPSNELTRHYEPSRALHSADEDRNHMLNLSELLRVIQFYNLNGYQCTSDPVNSEDGYDVSSGRTNCYPHAADYKPQDWHINLSELLRLVQFYNSGGYHYCNDAQLEGDGFCPGP